MASLDRRTLRRYLTRSDVLVVAVVATLALACVVVYVGGGTQTPWPHMFYLPVVVAAGVWGLWPGVAVGLAAGLLCGPIMPLDVAAGTPQTLGGWTLRTMFFILVAIVAGASRRRIIQLGEARQELLSAVSHEARTPLAAVLGFSQLVQERYDELADVEVREFVSLIHQEAVELSNVIDHYVLEGRLHHQMLVETVEVDVRHVVDVVLSGIPVDVRQSRIVARGQDVLVYGDPLRLRQVIRSLVNNALAYGGDLIVIDVRHMNGRGIVSIDDGRSGGESVAHRDAPPLGVGLAVARELTEMMDGSLLYRMDGPATFELRLPTVARNPRHARRGESVTR